MQKSILGIVIAAALVGGIGGYVYMEKMERVPLAEPAPAEEGATTTPEDAAGPSESPTAPAAGLTLAEKVALHATRDDCWSIINGNVYDLTSWIPEHPGGEGAILGLCGIDGSEKYNRKHGGGQRQATILEGFRISVH